MLNINNPLNYNSYLNALDEIASRFPSCKVRSIGKSWCKREIYSVTIGNPKHKNMLFLSGVSSQDDIPVKILLKFIERISTAEKGNLKLQAIKIQNILNTQAITFVPMLNPDGFDISLGGTKQAKCYEGLCSLIKKEDNSPWHANARGVDLRKNFYFDSKNNVQKPSASGYYGTSSLSEIESKELCKFLKANDFAHLILLSSGKDGISRYCSRERSDTAMMSQILKSVCGFPIKRTRSEEIDGNPAFWFSKSEGKPAFEFFINPESDFIPMYATLEEALILSAIM